MGTRQRCAFLGTAAVVIMAVLTVVTAASAQLMLTSSPTVRPDYSAMSFGRQLSFFMDAELSCFCETQVQASQATFVAKLPPGVRVVSAAGPFSVSGTPQTGEQVTVTNLNAPFGELEPLTVSIDNSIADGTALQASFELSGTGTINAPFQATRDSTGSMVSFITFAFGTLFASGNSLTIAGASDPSFNGTFVVLTATHDASTQTLTYAQAGTPNTTARGSLTLSSPFDTGVATGAFQAGYLPVTVSVVGSHDLCFAQATLGTPEFTSFTNGLKATASSESSLIGLFGSAASAGGATSALPFGSPIGEVVPGSGLTLLVGTQANVVGGFTIAPDLSAARDLAGSIGPNTLGVFEGFNEPGCEIDFPTLQFSNPNPYPVPAILDVTFDGFAAASNDDVVDPISGVVFGYPGSSFVSGSLQLSAGGGLESSRVSQEVRFTPNGNTLRTITENSCYSDAPACIVQPPTDTTVSFGFPGQFVIGNGQFGPGFNGFDPNLFLPNSINVDLEADSNIATFAGTGGVSLIRTGFASGSASLSIRIARGDANLSGTVAKLQITGHSPVSLLVTDSQGRRVGFLPAVPPPLLPGNPPSTAQQSPVIISEIFGASYTGPDTEPQTINIPNPVPGDYGVQVTGTGNGPVTIDMQTLDINDVVLSTQESTGTASVGSSNSIALTLQQDGSITMKSTCAVDATSLVAVARGGIRYNFGTGRFVQGVTITNKGTSTISGPVFLVLDNLSSNASLYTPDGTTGCAAPQGSPYVTVSAGDLAAGASVAATLQFTDPTKAAITYNTRVLAGPGSR